MAQARNRRAAKKAAAKRVATKRRQAARWSPPVDRYQAMIDSNSRAQAFERAALAYITGYKPVEQQTEAERLGLKLAIHLAHCFRGGDSGEAVSMLRSALAAFEERSPARKRYWAARAIAEWGHRWHQADNEAARAWVIEQCIRYLEVCDHGFAVLREDSASVGQRLDEYASNPAGKKGKKGAERILAEMIIEEGLDLAELDIKRASDGDADDEIDHLRKLISNDVTDEKNKNSQ